MSFVGSCLAYLHPMEVPETPINAGYLHARLHLYVSERLGSHSQACQVDAVKSHEKGNLDGSFYSGGICT